MVHRTSNCVGRPVIGSLVIYVSTETISAEVSGMVAGLLAGCVRVMVKAAGVSLVLETVSGDSPNTSVGTDHQR